MINIKDKSDCSGCYACVQLCPEKCIKMVLDNEGFWYPEVDISNCVNCGMCENVCQTLNPIKSSAVPDAYAAYNKNNDVRMQSSSGGIFTLIAEYVLDNNGVVFGAAFDEKFNVHHICIDNKDDLGLLRGSKYVQSSIGNTYHMAKQKLEEGKLVLFTGTPCQIDGLIHYLNKNYENLYTQDIICHGVPSPMIWQKYINYRENKSVSKTQRTFFRHKKYGWKMFSVQFIFENGTEYMKKFKEDLYMRAYLNNLCLRPSCYNCHSKTLNRNSDITLADFWGIDRLIPDMFDNKGTSLIFVNSPKGQFLMNNIKENIIMHKANADAATKYNTAAYRSVPRPNKREAFFTEIQRKNFDKVALKYTKVKLIKKIKNKLKYEIKKFLRRLK